MPRAQSPVRLCSTTARSSRPYAVATRAARSRSTIVFAARSTAPIRRLLGAHDPDRDDVAQLAMIELVTTIDRYRGECSLDSWTSTITARLVFKTIRRRRVERRYFAFDEPTSDDAPAPSRPSHDLGARDLLRRVAELLTPVEDVKVWTFLLHDAWGYDLREVAQITEVTVAAAQSRLVRGRAEVNARIAAKPELAAALAKVLA